MLLKEVVAKRKLVLFGRDWKSTYLAFENLDAAFGY